MPALENDFTAVQANPLFAFRAPANLPKGAVQRVHGDHFITPKEEVSNELSVLAIYPGMFRYRANPAMEIDFALWNDSDDDQGYSLRDWSRLTGAGFVEAQAKDFDVQYRYRQLWKPDMGKRITLGGRTKPATVLMWRTGEVANEKERAKLARSDDIQKSVEQKAAEGVKTAMDGLGMELALDNVSFDEGEEIEIGLREEV